MPQILVTGPQRSGTTITSRILAHDLGLTYIDETEYEPTDLPSNCVVQAPLALKNIVELSYYHPKLHFVYVIRPTADIKASMERIQWYKDMIDEPSFYETYINNCRLIWCAQKESLSDDRWSEIEYSSLTDHPLFLTDRTDFTVRQWQKDKPVGPRTWKHDRYHEFIES